MIAGAEAYSRAAMATGIATTLGFILAVFLTRFEYDAVGVRTAR
jgi:hypothetical protein